MSKIVYLNGEFLPRGEACISVDDRGFLFGDGVYEVTRALHGVLLEAEAHLERLQGGLAFLQIGSESSTSEGLLTISERLLAANELLEGHATVYVQVTRGAAPRTHHFPPAGTPPTIFASASRFVPPTALHEVGAAAITHPDLRWHSCDLKTVNLLPNVLAKQHAVTAGATEAVLIRNGTVTEGSHTSVFAVIDGVLRTHPRAAWILPGITRGIVVELARASGVPVEERPILVEELKDAEEIFLSGTTTDVMPITKLDDHVIGTGNPGPITRMLQAAYAARITGAASRPEAKPEPRFAAPSPEPVQSQSSAVPVSEGSVRS